MPRYLRFQGMMKACRIAPENQAMPKQPSISESDEGAWASSQAEAAEALRGCSYWTGFVIAESRLHFAQVSDERAERALVWRQICSLLVHSAGWTNEVISIFIS